MMCIRRILLVGVCWIAAYGGAAERFEAAALVDSFDFANVKDRDGRLLFDTEQRKEISPCWSMSC